jgi:hypothetical protein
MAIISSLELSGVGQLRIMFQHSMQTSRYELKYIVDESRAAALREFVRGNLTPDPYTKPEEGNAYWVYSLYCDSLQLGLYQSSKEGQKNRFKLRMRFYDDDPNHPVFLEIKRRLGDVIKKERAGVHREAAQQYLLGHQAKSTDLIPSREPLKARSALNNFLHLYHSIGAMGCVYVFYHREAYVAYDNDHVRVTFDRNVRAGRFHQTTSLYPPRDGVLAGIPGIILELKFTDRYPPWMRELVGTLNLWRVPMAKYVACLEKIRMPWLAMPQVIGARP